MSATESTLIYSSILWQNGQQRSLTAPNEVDPYDPRFSIHSGVGRRIFIDGNGYCYQSGHKSRIDITTSTYNSMLEVQFTPNDTLDAITFRMRSRRKEPAVPD